MGGFKGFKVTAARARSAARDTTASYPQTAMLVAVDLGLLFYLLRVLAS